MIITYLRSSSYSCHSLCEMKYFGEYVLGWRGPSNQKAEKGTIVHKVLELLGHIKLCEQNSEDSFEDDHIGVVNVNDYTVDNLIELVFEYYTKNSSNGWTKNDFKHCRDWTYKALEFDGGRFDPRSREIVMPELQFDFEIHEPWAMFNYDMPDGNKLEGFLALKGTIDQISKVDEQTYEITDWKTGRRIDWATGKEKTHESLRDDAQLRMYHYAAHHVFPDIKQILVTIYYINDGGPFTICFSNEDLPITERMLQKKFDKIKETEIPALHKSWKCTKFCHFGKTTFEGTNVAPIIEKRRGQPSKCGQPMTKCEQIKYCLERRPVDSVVKHMSSEGHDVSHYVAPGGVD